MEIVKDLISVVMTNYNTPEIFLREAIDSVLQQTYSNFEFIIVDDCSTDGSLDVIKSYIDNRIVILENENNIGLTKSLNKALNVAKGEFIARMDSDDICDLQRFEKQMTFLKNKKDVIVCGTWAKLFGNWEEEMHTRDTVCREIPTKEIYRVMLMFGNYPNIVHSSAMFNHKKLKENGIKYNEEYIYAQDYRMWVECSKYMECAIVPEILMNIRVRQGTISTSKKDIQRDCALRIMREQLNELGLTLNGDIEKYHENFLIKRHSYDKEYLRWLKEIIKANKDKKVYNQKILEDILWKKWAEIVYFGMRKCSIKQKIIRIITLPLKYYSELMAIRIRRKKKSRGVADE